MAEQRLDAALSGARRPQGPSRAWLFAVLCAVCIASAGGYLGWSMQRSRPAARRAPMSGQQASTIAALQQQPHLVFQHVARDDKYATLSLAARDTPAAARANTDLVCERLYFAGKRGLCVEPEHGAVFTTYTALIVGPDFKARYRLPLEGNISRARVSPDGRYGATTTFVFGHSYADADFSTQTLLIDMATGAKLAELEQFSVFRDGKKIQAEDFNFWGVTFARDSNRFYATLRTAERTYLVEGDVQARRMRVLHENVECPSLSPDNTRIAYKKLVGLGTWRLAVLELATLRETTLAETESIDDQAEWLDDGHVLYGKGADVWMVAADGSGAPRAFLADALSPAVVR